MKQLFRTLMTFIFACSYAQAFHNQVHIHNRANETILVQSVHQQQVFQYQVQPHENLFVTQPESIKVTTGFGEKICEINFSNGLVTVVHDHRGRLCLNVHGEIIH